MGDRHKNKVQSLTASNIDITEMRARCDKACKLLLADKEIAARILKSTVKEFEYIDLETIKNIYIEGTPRISEVSVNTNETNSILEGGNNESMIYGEGTFNFDIIFRVVYPNGVRESFLMKMIINLEAQNSYNPGYAIQTRGIYYACRMISAQYNREFKGDDYANIKKVYSIWICMNPTARDSNTITTYKITKNNDIGSSKDNPATYDLLSVLLVCLGGEEYENYNGIIKMLDILLSNKKTAKEKKKILKEEFGIPMEEELEKEIDNMCNMSDYYYSEGINMGMQQGMQKGLKAFIEICRDFNLTKEEIVPKIVDKFSLTSEEAGERVREYCD